MHWLPLVAMVIASALLFIRCPSVPRLVDTAMEPGNISTRSLVNPVSNLSRAEYNATRGDSDPKDDGTSTFTIKELFSERGRSEETDSDRTAVQSQSPKLQASYNSQERHTPTDHGPAEERSRDESTKRGSGPEGANQVSRGVSVESLMLKQRPRDLHPPNRASGVNQEEVDTQGADRGKMPMMPPIPAEGMDLGLESLLQVDDELILLASHPRVLFSTSPTPPKQPPLPLMLESGFIPDDVEESKAADDEDLNSINTARPKQARDGNSYRNLLLGLSDSSTTSRHRRRRQLGHSGLERSVCESVSNWVKDRRTAIDMLMQNVTVLEKFPTKKGMVTQYFYETRCRGPDHRRAQAGEHGMAGGGCLGVDKRHWVSECQTKQTFVRAFTSDTAKGVGWRWIRIDSACVCVLYSKAHKNRLMSPGRGNR